MHIMSCTAINNPLLVIAGPCCCEPAMPSSHRGESSYEVIMIYLNSRMSNAPWPNGATCPLLSEPQNRLSEPIGQNSRRTEISRS